jgi:septal ring factor EnvC (AmiA/AmiB activator)
MRSALVVLTFVLVGCVAAGEPARRHRWPKHRQEKDQKIEELLVRVDKLEKELASTRAEVAKLQASRPAPTTNDLPQSAGATP